MNAVDFYYDGILLSDFGCIICSFESSNSPETITMGSEITFTQTPVSNGKYYMTTAAKYDNCIETEFCICKDPELLYTYENRYFTLEEQQDLMRWLNRSKMCHFYPIEKHRTYIYYEGSFNVSKVELNGHVIGMSLHFLTNRPFALHEDVFFDFEITNEVNTCSFDDISDEIGYEYPKVVITLKESGNLIIENNFVERQTIVENCVAGETITMDNLIISTDNADHALTLMNDFNFKFPRIYNTMNDRENIFTINLPCSIQFKYNPIKKVGI